MNLVPTDLNQRLANAVRYSVDADRFYIGGKAGFWRLVGIGTLVFGIGSAIGIGCYGYSFVARNKVDLASFSSILSKALSDARLKVVAEGTVQIQPKELALAPNQTISLDNKTRVAIDPNARVRADGEITIQGPAISTQQLGSNRAPSAIPNIVNFTVFKSVPFEKGTVQTGWIFLTSAQRVPTEQYCYYTEESETPGRNVMLDIGQDEKLEAPKILPKNFDIAQAFSRCVWFQTP